MTPFFWFAITISLGIAIGAFLATLLILLLARHPRHVCTRCGKRIHPPVCLKCEWLAKHPRRRSAEGPSSPVG